MKIDLNCDTGESFGVYSLGEDAAVMPLVTSVNIACGFHASDASNIWKAVKLAKQYGVAIGAHPSFPDLVGFGRRVMNATFEEIKADIIYQVGAVDAFCKAEGLSLQHVKAHGALYNIAEKDLQVALAISEGIKAVDENLIMVCMSNSAMVEAAKQTKLRYVEEFFADRAYTDEGRLVSRKEQGAVIHDVAEVSRRVLKMVKENKVTSINGKEVDISAQTICVHGDTLGAVEMIKCICENLAAENIALESFGKWL